MWLISILAMLCWSGSDLFSKAGSRQNDRLSHYKMGIAVGAVMGLHAFREILIGGVSFSLWDLWTYLPASIFYISSMLIGYLGLRYIELSVSSPICNSSGALALLLSLLYFGIKWTDSDELEGIYLNGPIVAGVVLILIGVLALGLVEYFEDDEAKQLRRQQSNRKYTKSLLAILLPVIYCLLDACGTFIDTLIADRYTARLIAGGMDAAAADGVCGERLNTAYELTWFGIAVLLAIYVFAIRRERVSLRYDGIKVAGAVCETVGQIFYMMVVVSAYKVGLVIISAYCAVSLLWGRIFMKEKLSGRHYAAIAVVFLGILILGFYDV